MFWPSPKIRHDVQLHLSKRGGRKWAKLQSRRTAAAMLSSCIGGPGIAPWCTIRYLATKRPFQWELFVLISECRQRKIHKHRLQPIF